MMSGFFSFANFISEPGFRPKWLKLLSVVSLSFQIHIPQNRMKVYAAQEFPVGFKLHLYGHLCHTPNFVFGHWESPGVSIGVGFLGQRPDLIRCIRRLWSYK